VAFLEKKDFTVLKVKITSKGRNLLSQGNLNFKYFELGDSEIDYNFINLIGIDNYKPLILTPFDKNPKLLSHIYSGDTTGSTYVPANTNYPKQFILANSIEEIGFFSGNTILTDISHVKQPNIVIDIDSINGGNSVNLYQSSDYISSSPEPAIGDILMVKWVNQRGVDNNFNLIDNINPTPYLFYKITNIISGTLSGNDLVVNVDRELPNFSLVSGSEGNGAFAMLFNNFFINENTLTPEEYANNSLTDFINNSDCNIPYFPFWNLNIIYSEEIAGVKSGNTKFYNLNSSGLTGFINYIQEQSPIYRKLGVIHYSNVSASNLYGEGIYKNTPILNIPTLMWHKSNNISMGLILSGNTIQKRLNKIGAIYFDLVDNVGNIVGKIFSELKLFVIEDQDLLFAMSYKSNRNWTLPEFNLSIGNETPIC